LEEPARNIGIVYAFEKTDEAGPIVLRGDIIIVNTRANASYDLALAFGQPKTRTRMLIDRVFFRVDQLHAVHLERRHPVWVARINVPDHANELHAVGFRADFANLNVVHWAFLLGAFLFLLFAGGRSVD